MVSTKSYFTSAAGVRWDSDHVVTLSDELAAIAQEVVRGDYLDRVHLGLDFFDASINRVAAWVIGTRNTAPALLMALVEPTALLRGCEARGRFDRRAWPCSRNSRRCPSAPSGIITADPKRAGRIGLADDESPRHTRATCSADAR